MHLSLSGGHINIWATALMWILMGGAAFMVLRYITEDPRNRERLLHAFKVAGGGDRRLYSADCRTLMGLTPHGRAMVIARLPFRSSVIARFYGPERVLGAQLELNREVIDIAAPKDSELLKKKLSPMVHAADAPSQDYALRLFVSDPDFHEIQFPVSEHDARQWLRDVSAIMGVEPVLTKPKATASGVS